MLTFEKIMTRGVVFYDEEYAQECKEFCKIRHISYLPHIKDKSLGYFYDKKTKNFRRKLLEENQIVSINDNIFRSDLIENFQDFEVFFVMDKDEIVGVVHYSDYNRSPVYEFLYKKLFLLERGLIYLFVKHSGLSQYDLNKFRKIGGNEGKDKLLSRKDFRDSGISLLTILRFTQKKELLKINGKDINHIIKLRNIIAHSDDLISKIDAQQLKFDFRTLANLLRGFDSLNIALKKVANRLYFMQAVSDENFASSVSPIEEYMFR